LAEPAGAQQAAPGYYSVESSDDRRVVLLGRRAIEAGDQGNLREAKRLWLAAAIASRAADVSGVWRSTTLYNLGVTLRLVGETVAAEPHFREALHIRVVALEPGSLSIAEAASALAECLHGLGDYEEAAELQEALLERALADAFANERAEALSNLANTYAALGRVTEAEPLFNRAIELFQTDASWVAFGLEKARNNFGVMLMDHDRLPEAAELFEKVLEVYRAELPANHPHLGSAVQNLAGVYDRQARSPEAWSLYEESLRILRAGPYPDQLAIATIIKNQGAYLDGRGLYADALMKFREALEIEKRFPPRQALTMYQTLGSISDVSVRADDIPGARNASRRSLSVGAQTWCQVHHRQRYRSSDCLGHSSFARTVARQATFELVFDGHARAAVRRYAFAGDLVLNRTRARFRQSADARSEYSLFSVVNEDFVSSSWAAMNSADQVVISGYLRDRYWSPNAD